MGPHHVIVDELTRQGYLLRREHPSLSSTLSRLTADGVLTRILPGAYVAASEQNPRVWARAVCALHRGGVVTGRAAAALTFWPDLPVQRIDVAVPWDVGDKPGFCFTRREIPATLVLRWSGVRLTTPAATAMDLCSTQDAEVIDRVLLTRAARVSDLTEALLSMPRRRGNVERRRQLLDSRGAPWSAAERVAHRLLRAAGIAGWTGNLRVRRPGGGSYFLDIAFPEHRLAIEIEGNRFHSDPAALHKDRTRHNAVTLLGWTVLRVDWRMLHDDPEGFIALVRAFLDQ